MEETRRVLRPGGVCVLSTPDPRWERVATRLRLLKDAGHEQTLDLDQLRNIARRAGLEVEEASKFMFSPVGFPAERQIEKLLTRVGLRALLANQLMVARKPVPS
jgi:hypothetical protein